MKRTDRKALKTYTLAIVAIACAIPVANAGLETQAGATATARIRQPVIRRMTNFLRTCFAPRMAQTQAPLLRFELMGDFDQVKRVIENNLPNMNINWQRHAAPNRFLAVPTLPTATWLDWTNGTPPPTFPEFHIEHPGGHEDEDVAHPFRSAEQFATQHFLDTLPPLRYRPEFCGSSLRTSDGVLAMLESWKAHPTGSRHQSAEEYGNIIDGLIHAQREYASTVDSSLPASRSPGIFILCDGDGIPVASGAYVEANRKVELQLLVSSPLHPEKKNKGTATIHWLLRELVIPMGRAESLELKCHAGPEQFYTDLGFEMSIMDTGYDSVAMSKATMSRDKAFEVVMRNPSAPKHGRAASVF